MALVPYAIIWQRMGVAIHPLIVSSAFVAECYMAESVLFRFIRKCLLITEFRGDCAILRNGPNPGIGQ